VQTNDPAQPSLSLVVTGKVVKFVEVRPAQVRLEGRAGVPLSVDVEILPNKDYPFTILEVRTEKNDVVRSELVEQCTAGNDSRCLIRVENLKTTSGSYTDTLTVRTDNTGKPSFSIPVIGIIN
jgi:hypothetical protein